jgi:3-oxoacyl-[acyl-carrier-protein] synthase-3
MDEAARDILEQHKVTADQIALVIPHQANLRIIESISQYLELPMDRFFVNVGPLWETRPRHLSRSRSTKPVDQAESKPGDLTLLVAFGAGLTYASALIRW